MAKLSSSLVISLTDRVSGPARGIMGTLGRLKHAGDRFGSKQMAMTSGLLSNLKGLLAAAAAYASLTEGISGTIGAAIKFEDTMSDIRKVVDFDTPQQFKQMGDDILKMSQQLGMSTSSIGAIVAAWGQANAKPEELLALTQLTAEASVAWETTAAETGDALAKIRTSLGLTVDETRLVADAINFLGNTSASGTKDLLAFSRGLGSGKLAGFAAKETLAFGAAMISSGFEAEVAETSFRNMAFALTAGAKATKEQRNAYKRLGFDGKKVSKAMQKDAVGTTLAVLDAIKKLPKDEQGAIAASLFGKEARAIPALLNNLPELRRLLTGVADDTSYAGSAHKEFLVAMEKTSANLAKFKSVLSGIGIGIGQLALPTLNDWLKTMSDTLLTLDQRVTIFDKFGKGISGFMSGLGFDGSSIGEQFGKLYEGIFGRIDDFEKDTDRLGAIFLEFRNYGAAVREFGSAIGQSIGDVEKFFNLDPGTIGETLGMLGENGFKLAVAGVGITLVAGALGKLARALLFLSGVSTLIGGAKGIAKLLGALGGLAGNVPGTIPTGKTPKVPSAPGGAGILALLTSRATLWTTAALSLYEALNSVPHEGYASSSKNDPEWFAKREAYRRQFGEVAWEGGMHRAGRGAGPHAILDPKSTAAAIVENWPGGSRKPSESERYADSMKTDFGDRNRMGVTSWFDRIDAWWKSPPSAPTFPGKEADDVYSPPAAPTGTGNYWLDAIFGAGGNNQVDGRGGDDALGTKSVTISGTPTVTLTNPPQPTIINVNASVVVNEAADGAAVAREFASSVKTAIAGTHGDMNHQAHA